MPQNPKHPPQYLARVTVCLNRIRQLCEAGIASKLEIGAFMLGKRAAGCSKQHKSGMICNFLSGRVPAEKNLALLEKWVRVKEAELRKVLK